ncbi:uncharacterized protein DNG_07950 [Cephalotrichum gorgonifer]|uniref:Protein artemis n=1 Tax=Cephalotrichum gorgonifer TaxID=2041049 RepID=A0AAE8SY18_9PEZI|nr:uncharacterized protein DNG_07950 [Cephalotrichum gorgonifer]
MSTFDGIISELPDIRVDFFRHKPAHAPPLACFLSHVHSDHLAGLESLRAPFVYCSAATREILLRLERYPCRINHAKGVLEARVQTYKHLRNLLKPIPPETPTTLVLRPGLSIRVTLFDANHCPGAVMFLFESDATAVLYTGDLRSEPWFVNSISRSPSLVEYTSGIRTLDKIYLDTSFTGSASFQTKAQGISELIGKVSAYPEDTIFHIQAWTFGYEDVWIALSKALKSRVHVDEYKMRLYTSLASRVPDTSGPGTQVHHLCPEAPALVGFMCGNTYHPGCLTREETVRLHSCEKGNYCDAVNDSPVVWILPVVARLPDGVELCEIGVGGGGDDLEREAELDHLSLEETDVLMKLISESEEMPQDRKEIIREFLLNKAADGRNISLDLDMASFDDKNKTTLKSAVESIAKVSSKEIAETVRCTPENELPRRIYFPYSRHSSYPELCHFVEAFRPRDVWPCTVRPVEWLNEGKSIRSLFGDRCSGDTFEHDLKMETLDSQISVQAESQLHSSLDLADQESSASLEASQQGRSLLPTEVHATMGTKEAPIEIMGEGSVDGASQPRTDRYQGPERQSGRKRDFETYTQGSSSQASEGSQAPPRVSCARVEAYNAMMRNVLGSGEGGWEGITLLSTRDSCSRAEPELGDG